MPIAPIPVSIITGFLGAGKTTLLNRLLKDPALVDTIVIVNEFGEIGLDHLFIETQDDNMILMASGCLCCTIRGDLISTLEDLIKKYDTGALKAFKRVIIETTGLADPAPILQSLIGHPMILVRYTLDGVVTLVDAVNGSSTLDHHREAVKQAAIADRIVLTKTDLQTDTDALRARLKKLNPAALIIDTQNPEADAAHLIGTGAFDLSQKIPDVAAWLKSEAYEVQDHHHAHHHDHDHDHHEHDHAHHHDINRHDDHIRAFCLTTNEAIPIAAFEMFLTLLQSAHGPNLLRMKGIVKLAEHPDHPVILHGVQHVFHPPVKLSHWPDDDHRTKLVFITKDLDESFVSRLWDAFLDRPGIDTPDRSAMFENPLSLRRE
jgi:G3E family GTPase